MELKEKLDDRNIEIYYLWHIKRLKLREITERFGISEQRVHQIASRLSNQGGLDHMKVYEFLSLGESCLESWDTDAISAFHRLKRQDQDNLLRLKKFGSAWHPKDLPEGFSLLNIGYGLSIAYRIMSQ